MRYDAAHRAATFFASRAIGDDELVHPYLAPVVHQLAPWLGYTSLHGGAFIHEGGAWALLAARSGGKSTTLARLAQAGVAVLSDDLVAARETLVMAGPRCIDLRPESAREIDVDVREVRGGTRSRLELPMVEPSAPLRGFFLLDWGDRTDIAPLGPSERLVAVARHCDRQSARGRALLELAELPAFRIRRPPDLAELDTVCGKLLEAASR